VRENQLPITRAGKGSTRYAMLRHQAPHGRVEYRRTAMLGTADLNGSLSLRWLATRRRGKEKSGERSVRHSAPESLENTTDSTNVPVTRHNYKLLFMNVHNPSNTIGTVNG
jgi:hypothetical protein